MSDGSWGRADEPWNGLDPLPETFSERVARLETENERRRELAEARLHTEHELRDALYERSTEVERLREANERMATFIEQRIPGSQVYRHSGMVVT